LRYTNSFNPILEKDTSPSVRLNLMVFYTDDGDGWQPIAGADFDDDSLQADHGVRLILGYNPSL
jgi:hypothetical protein